MHRRVRVLGEDQAANGPRLVLREEDGVVEILAGRAVLLSSAALETELAFGRLAGHLAGPSPKRVLVGGLGFGATVRGVLEAVPSAEVVVVEKFEAVVRLVRGELAGVPSFSWPERVRVVIGDVADAIAAGAGGDAFDLVLLDVDNGPEWATVRENARLYTASGLARAHAAVSPGGAFAVWSGYPADAFLSRLRAAGFTPKLVPLREKGRVRARAYVGMKGY